jgi:hypothetical protein
MGSFRQPVCPYCHPYNSPETSGRQRTPPDKDLLRRYGLTPLGHFWTRGRELHDLRRDVGDPAPGHLAGDIGAAGGVGPDPRSENNSEGRQLRLSHVDGDVVGSDAQAADAAVTAIHGSKRDGWGCRRRPAGGAGGAAVATCTTGC